MNTMFLKDLTKGCYGRKIAYTDVEKITESNVVKIVGECIGVFNRNKTIIKYLWEYKKGDQPILYRKKIVRPDVKNTIVENHAWEIVQFKNGQTNGEPIQLIARKKDDNINKAVEKLNDYMSAANKHARDISSGEWTSAVGTGFKGVQFKEKGEEVPFRIIVPTPLNTFIIYSRSTGEPMLSVQELYDEAGERYLQCFSKTHEFRIKNSELMNLVVDSQGSVAKSRLHAFGDIPIVEYPNNQDRISDIEIVITMLDAINNMQSNRMDSVEQFVQSFMKFINCEIDDTTFEKMKEKGAISVKSTEGTVGKADVDIMTQELNQTESQVAKDDLWNNVLSISAIPNKQGNTGGDTQGAVELRNGWDFSKQRAKLKDPYTVEAERHLANTILNIIRIRKGENECKLSQMDFDVQINHSPQDNMQVKAQTYQMLVKAGIHPLVAIKTCGLWGDAEKTYVMSKPYLDALYKTIDQVIEEQGLEEQIQQAEEIIKKQNTGQE